jgi:hypothetical protein
MKRKHNIMTAALVAGGALMFGSCNDWLSLDPEDSVTASKYWKTESDVESALSGIYCSVLSASSKMYTDGELRGDYTTPGTRTTHSGYYSMYNGDLTSSNSLVAWTAYYTAINNCNLLLEKADQALANDASFSATRCRKYKAQATVIRAMMYFYLIRTYKDVPYITWAYYDDTVDRDCAPTDQLDILNDLIAQLEQVERDGDLDYTYSLTSVAQNKGQVTMYALKTLLADMYRWQGALTTNIATSQAAYARCVELCDEVIHSGQFALVDVPKTDAKKATGSYLEDATSHADSCFFVLSFNSPAADFFKKVYVDGNSDESIFELQVDDYTATPYFAMCAYSDRAYFLPNADHVRDDIFPSTENACAAAGNYEDVRYSMSAFSGLNWKYAGADMEGNIYATSSTEYRKNIIVYRLAEVYLMKAEALVQEAMYQEKIGGPDVQKLLLQAYKAVYKVRQRASAVETTDVTVGSGSSMQVAYWDQLLNDEDFELTGSATLTTLNMEQFVLDEEGRELAFEGKRWFDVLRTAARNNYGAGTCTGGSLNYLMSIVMYSTAIDKATYLRNAYKVYLRHYLPYPLNDVRTNSLLNQNPAYGDE